MAWFNSGTWDGISAADLSDVIASVVRAYNERAALLNLTQLTLWGSHYPTAADIAGSLEGATVKANLQTLVSYTRTMVTTRSWAVNPPSDPSLHDGTTLALTIYYPGEVANSDSVLLIGWALSLKTLFDKLIYPRDVAAPTVSAYARKTASASGSAASPSTVWASAVTAYGLASETTGSGGALSVYSNLVVDIPTPPGTTCTASIDAMLRITPAWAAQNYTTILPARCVYTTWQATQQRTGDIGDIGSTNAPELLTVTYDGQTWDTTDGTVSHSTNGIPAGDMTISVDTNFPDSGPSGATHQQDSSSSQLQGLYMFFNISPDLTDQT